MWAVQKSKTDAAGNSCITFVKTSIHSKHIAELDMQEIAATEADPESVYRIVPWKTPEYMIWCPSTRVYVTMGGGISLDHRDAFTTKSARMAEFVRASSTQYYGEELPFEIIES